MVPRGGARPTNGPAALRRADPSPGGWRALDSKADRVLVPRHGGGGAIRARGSRPIDYPESDGRPLAETEVHLQVIFDLYAALRQHFADRPEVHVSSNLLLYYEEGAPQSRVAPDIMVVFGVSPGLRRTYKLWEEEKAPDVVIEVTSRGTQGEDLGRKQRIYASLGVTEYYMTDPTAEYLRPPLRAWRLQEGRYVEVLSRRLVSPALGLEVQLVGGRLRLADPDTGRLLAIPAEYVQEIASAREAREAAEERAQRFEEQARREAEAREAEARKAHESRIGIARSLLAQGMEPATVMEILGLQENDLS